MKGLDLAQEYYEQIGAPMLLNRFGDMADRIAVGLVGPGSECFGFDDEISRDHDWGPGFCIWLNQDDYRKQGKAMQTAYSDLPRAFAGFVVDYHSPNGYTKRVNLAVGLLHPECNTPFPSYGKNGKSDEVHDLGKLVDEGPQVTFSLDLARYAPDDWDGQVWFSVGSDWAGSDRRLTARIVAANEDVEDGLLPE